MFFKWVCLFFAVLAAGGLGWLLYDLDGELKQTARAVREFRADLQGLTQTAREVGDEIGRTTRTLNKDLPGIVENTRATAEAVARITEEMNQFRKLVGGSDRPAEEGLPVYANSLLEFIQASGGKVGLRNPLGRGLVLEQPADRWVMFARSQALALVFIARNRADYLNTLAGSYYIQVGDEAAKPLKEWLRANHPLSKELK
jgi:hypothetical protein